MFLNQLLADAEILEDVAEDFVGGDVAGDGGEGVDCLPDVLTYQVGRDVGSESFLSTEKGSACVGEGLDMALVCDQSSVAVRKEITL